MSEELNIKKIEEEAEQELLNKKEEDAEMDFGPLVEFPDVQKVEVLNQVEIPEQKGVDLSNVEETLRAVLSELKVKDVKIDTSRIETRLGLILEALGKEVIEKETVDYTDILTAIQTALPDSLDYDEFFERLEEKFDKLDLSTQIKQGLKGFHSSGWLPVVQAVNDLETTTTDGSQKSQIQAADSFSIDAFGRWRVSEPTTIFDSKQIFDKQPLVFDDQEVSGSGTTSVYSQDTASTVIGVAADTAGKRVRQTFMRFNYQPGKSQFILVTGTINNGGAGIKAGMGYYDDQNGLFAQCNEGTVQLVKRSYYTGAAVDTEVDQADWNIDPFDGTGPSGVTLDSTKSQILIIDFEWLGVGRVRMGWVVDGKIYYAHEFLHSNRTSGVYMSTPNLPIRYEISNDGTGQASELEHICSSVMSEGGQEKTGILRHYSTPELAALTADTTYVLAAGRLKSSNYGASIDIQKVSLLAQTADQISWQLVAGGTYAGSLTFADFASSVVQIAPGAKANTFNNDGVVIDGGFFTQDLPANISVPNALRLGADIAGTAQVFFFVITPITNNATVRGAITWRELS